MPLLVVKILFRTIFVVLSAPPTRYAPCCAQLTNELLKMLDDCDRPDDVLVLLPNPTPTWQLTTRLP